MKRQSFVAFATGVLRLKFTAPWRALLAVAVDGVQPCQLLGNDRDLARTLFGNVDEIDPALRRILIWRLGRASGKSTVASALAVYCAWTADLSHVGRGQVPCAFVVSPSKPIAKIAVAIGRELVRGTPLERHVEDDTADGFTLRRSDGRLVEVRSVAASRGGANLRGRDVVVLILDESEFFASGDDGDFAVTDRDQVSAAMPRLLAHVIAISTPWPVETFTGEAFDRNYGHLKDAVAALGTSTFMRPTEQLERDIAREMGRDEENAQREYFCVPGARGGSRLFVEGLREAVVEGRAAVIAAGHGASVGAGGDLGLERDSSAIAIASRVEDVYELLESDEIRPAKGQPLSPRYVIVDRFAPVMRRHGVTSIALDAHYRQSAIEHLNTCHLSFEDAPSGAQGKYDSYMFLRGLLRASKLRLPNDPRLLAQLRAVTAVPVSGGSIRIASPRRAGGGHGDVVSALVLAIWRASGGYQSHAGLFEWMRRKYGDPSERGPQSAATVEPPPVQVILNVPAKFAGSSHVVSGSGRSYGVEAGQISVLASDVSDMLSIGFEAA